ncbi:MAG: hypothetical protein HKN50_00945 [Gammaproteobacteria bacterium]|nr:hypothetical protein [Gammaproteobacteria bacterium]
MDASWLTQLRQDSAVIVPTRSLANGLQEQLAALHLNAGRRVWEAPNILLWQDYLTLIWQQNRLALHQQCGATNLINEQQALLLWTRVIEASKRRESMLTLLDVKQTARAVQKAWRLMHDWQLSEQDLHADHVADTEQFLSWLSDYRKLLAESGFLDGALLQQQLLEAKLELPFSIIHWHSYDLITAAQQRHNRYAENAGMELHVNQHAGSAPDNVYYAVYQDDDAELRAAMQLARNTIEANPAQRINLVIPDLAQRQVQVREIARDMFYPSVSPLEIMHQPCVYRFSLGQPLSEWPAIEAALRVIKLLRNQCTCIELSFVLRNEFFGLCRSHRAACRGFDLWLQSQRLRFISIDHLPELYRQYTEQEPEAAHAEELFAALSELVSQRQALTDELRRRKVDTNFSALNFSEWVLRFQEWLNVWGWQTGIGDGPIDSVQYQLLQRWQKLLNEYQALATVQRLAGLSRALDILEQMTRDTVFLPKAVASPIFISGVYEAIGREADLCLLTGMNERYPTPPLSDAFVPNRLLLECGFPDASATSAFAQAQRVINSLLAFNRTARISYARRSGDPQEIAHQAAPLFRQQSFVDEQWQAPELSDVELEAYTDTHGPQWPDLKYAKGGSQIFVNQSQCAFKAFATHQLRYQREEEAEFGLDARERGSVVHRMLQLAWQQLGSKAALLELDESARREFATRMAAAAIADPGIQLSADKRRLLDCEQQRLTALLLAWLAIEDKRPQGFAVVETEQDYAGELGGIRFNFSIDRLDICDDGRAVLIDYKTGAVNRQDWLGERIKQPQLPLYALELDQKKRTPLSGIAYGQVQQPQPKWAALAESGLINKGTAESEQQWLSAHEQWPTSFAQLASDFKQGLAEVFPIDDEVCRYCDLKSMCRVAQLKQLALGEDDAD